MQSRGTVHAEEHQKRHTTQPQPDGWGQWGAAADGQTLDAGRAGAHTMHHASTGHADARFDVVAHDATLEPARVPETTSAPVEQAVPQAEGGSADFAVADLGGGKPVGADWEVRDEQQRLEQRDVGLESWGEWAAVAGECGADRAEEGGLPGRRGGSVAEVEVGVENVAGVPHGSGVAVDVAAAVVADAQEAQSSFIDESFAVSPQQGGGVGDGWGALDEGVEGPGGDGGFDAFDVPQADEMIADVGSVEQKETEPQPVDVAPAPLEPAQQELAVELQSGSGFYDAAFAVGQPQLGQIDNARDSWGSVAAEDKSAAHEGGDRLEQGQGRDSAGGPAAEQGVGIGNSAVAQQDNNSSRPLATKGLAAAIPHPQTKDRAQMQEQPAQMSGSAVYSLEEPQVSSSEVNEPVQQRQHADVEYAPWGGTDFSEAQSGMPPDEQVSASYAPGSFDAPPPQAPVSVSDSFASVVQEQRSEKRQSLGNPLEGLHAGHPLNAPGLNDYHRKDESREANASVDKGHELYQNYFSVEQVQSGTSVGSNAGAPVRPEDTQGFVAEERSESQLKIEEAFGGGWDAEVGGAADRAQGAWNWADSGCNPPAVSEVPQRSENVHTAEHESASANQLREGVDVSSEMQQYASTPAGVSRQERVLPEEGIESNDSPLPFQEPRLETFHFNQNAGNNGDVSSNALEDNGDSSTPHQGQLKDDGSSIAEVRSTDVDVSSTIAGTDVPSVAGPSSLADETEWDTEPAGASLPPPVNIYAPKSPTRNHEILQSQYVDMDQNKVLDLSLGGNTSTSSVQTQALSFSREQSTLESDGTAAKVIPQPANPDIGFDASHLRPSENKRDGNNQALHNEASCADNRNQDDAGFNENIEQQTNRSVKTEAVFSWDSHGYDFQTKDNFESSFAVGTGESSQPQVAAFEIPGYEHTTNAATIQAREDYSAAGSFPTDKAAHLASNIEGLQGTRYGTSKDTVHGPGETASHVPMVPRNQASAVEQVNETGKPPHPLPEFQSAKQLSQEKARLQSISNSTGANSYWSERLQSPPSNDNCGHEMAEPEPSGKNAGYNAIDPGLFSSGASTMSERGVSTGRHYQAGTAIGEGVRRSQAVGEDPHIGTAQGLGYQDMKGRRGIPRDESDPSQLHRGTAHGTLEKAGQWVGGQSPFPGSEPFQVENQANVDTTWSHSGAVESEFYQRRNSSVPATVDHTDSSTLKEGPDSKQEGNNVESDNRHPELDASRNSAGFQSFTDGADFSAYAPRQQAQENINTDFSSYAPITSHSNLPNRNDNVPEGEILRDSNTADKGYVTPPASEYSLGAKQEPRVDNGAAHFQPSGLDIPVLPPYSNQSVRDEPTANCATYDASSYSSLSVNGREIEGSKNDAPWTQNFAHERNGILGDMQSGDVAGWGEEASFPPQPANAPDDAAVGFEAPAPQEQNASDTAPSSVGIPSTSSVDQPVGMVQEQLGVEDFYGNHTFEAYAPRPTLSADTKTSYYAPNVQAKPSETQGVGIPVRDEVQRQTSRSEISLGDNFYEGPVPFPPQPDAPSSAGPHLSSMHETGTDHLNLPGHLNQADPAGVSGLTMEPGMHSAQGIDFYKPNTSEVALDNGMYSYPFSIMDAGPSGGLEHRPPRPVISWGFGGSLVTTFPGRDVSHTSNIGNEVPGGTSNTVRIYDLGSILRDVADDDIAAVMEALPPPNFPAISPDLLPLADMCERLANMSVGLKTEEADGRSALWRLLALMCKNCTSDWRSQAGSAISGPTSVPMFGRGNSSSFLAGQITKESPLKRPSAVSKRTEFEQMEAAVEVERLITQGNSSEAIRVAQEAGLWSLALVLASTLNRDLYHQAISAFAKSNLNDGSALQTLCFTMAENDAEIIRKATSASGLTEWRKSVGILLTSRQSSMNYDRNGDRFLRLIEQLGDALISHRADYVAGHVCYLISGRIEALDASQIPMLGGDRKIPAGRPRSYGSPAVALQSLVFETIANVLRGEAFPHILPFRLILAEAICATGRPDVALKHCESMSKSVRSVFEAGRQDIASQIFTPPFLASLESLEQKLRAHLGLHDVNEKRGTLTSLGQSLSAVLSRSKISSRISTAMKTSQGLVSKGLDSRTSIPQSSPQSQPLTGAYQAAPPAIPPVQKTQGAPMLNPAVTAKLGRPTPVHSSTPLVSTSSLPGLSVSGQMGNRTSSTTLQARGADGRQTSTMKQEAPSSNERWNSFVSKTIGVLAPADGDLSPPPPSRSNNRFPMNADPAPSIGLGHGTGTRAPGYDLSTSHMRSASMSDMPMGMMTVPNVSHEQIPPSNASGTNQSVSSGNARSAPGQDRSDGQRSLNGTTVQEATSHINSGNTLHRRSTSDITMASQTSERKPPRPPRRAPSASVSAIETSDGRVAPKGWSSRFRERLMSAFRGPPRAHMGNENKFVFDRERGRWVIEGEDPEPEDDVPPPPPDDDAVFGGSDGQVQTSVSYDNLRQGPLESQSQQLPRSHSMQDSRLPPDLQASESTEMARASAYSPYTGSYSTHQSSTQWGAVDNFSSRDNTSEFSGTSSTSAQMPLVANRSQSSSPAQPMAAPNRFRSQSGRRTGRRAYVDTFNKGQVPSAPSASAGPIARPVMPGMAGLGGKSNSFNVFTPSPAPSSGTDLSESSTHQTPVSYGPPFAQGRMNDNGVSSENFMPKTPQGATSSQSEQYSRIAGNPRLGA